MGEKSLFQPADACIWMRAGFLAWKVCDRDFNCESCPLDAAITAPRSAARHGAEAVSLTALPESRLYGRGHTWLQVEADGHLRVGLDAFASRLLGRPERVHLPAIGDGWVDGAIAIETTAGCVGIAAAAAGVVSAQNGRLHAEPELLQSDPYGHGWLAVIRPVGAWRHSLSERAEAERTLAFDLRHLRTRLAALLLGAPGDLGPTLQDGGEPLSDLKEILGKEGWIRLVRELLA